MAADAAGDVEQGEHDEAHAGHPEPNVAVMTLKMFEAEDSVRP